MPIYRKQTRRHFVKQLSASVAGVSLTACGGGGGGSSNSSSSSSSGTVTVASFSEINSYFDRGFYAEAAFQDSGMTVAASEGSTVAAFREMVQGTGKKLSLNTGSGSQTPSTFPVPTAPHGGAPLYSADDGGFVHMFNGFNKGYGATAEADLAPKIELVYVCRAYPTIRQENFHSGYGWPNYKFGNDGSAIVGIGNFVSTYTGGKGGFDELEVVVINEVYTNDASRSGEIFISDSRGDLVSQGSFTDSASGSNFIRNAGIGSSGHGQNHDFFGMWYTLGRTLTPTERAAVLAKLKTRYPVGKTPTKPHCRPSIAWDSATQSFVVTLNYKPGTAGLALDPAQTVVRWYLGDQLGSSTGNMLDKQSLFRTTDGNTLTLKRSDFPTQFPSPPSTNYLNVGVTVANTAGTKWREVCAFPFRDNQA